MICIKFLVDQLDNLKCKIMDWRGTRYVLNNEKMFLTNSFKTTIIFQIVIENRRGITSAHKMQTSKIKFLLQRKMDLLFMNILSHTLLQKTFERNSFSVPSTTRYQSLLVHEIPPCAVSFMSSKNLRLYIY